jgi:dihydrofolate reductase
LAKLSYSAIASYPEAVRHLKATASRDLTVGGPDLAAQAIQAGLVDEYHVFLVPVIVGGGKRWLPDHNLRVDLETSTDFATARSTSTTAPRGDRTARCAHLHRSLPSRFERS